jgi:DNA-binding NtrC family response regulator
MDLLMQSKLLRVLQEQEVTRVGGSDTIKLDVRVIIATHKNLPDEVARGHFREDLYYRLMGIPVFLPPLRDRGNDIAILARHFIKDYCSKNKIKAKRLSPEAVSKLFAHTFPGNIRELKAIVDLAIVMSDNDVIEADHLQIRYSSFLNEMLSSEMSLEEFEKAIIQHYLMKYNNKVRLVADKLGIGKSTIYRLFPGKRSDDTDD